MRSSFVTKLHELLLTKAPYPLFRASVWLWDTYKKIRMPECEKSFGEANPNQTFYVIRLYPPATGFLANYNYVLGYMKHAYDCGWIPIIDMQNYETLYQEKEPVMGTTNVWEYFFEQPLDKKTGRRYSLAEVYSSKNVILSDGNEHFCNYSGDEDTLKWQSEMAELCPFNKETEQYIQNVYQTLKKDIPGEVDLIGVPIRGAELKKRVIGHYVQASPEEIAEMLEERLTIWRHKGREMAIFVNSDEEETIDFFRNRFPNVYYTHATRFKNYSEKYGFAENVCKNSTKYQTILEYLTNTYILSQCDSFIGSMNNGWYTALIWNHGRYSHVEMVDKGIYK